MANRNTLHISKMEEFKKWLVKDGWGIEEPKGIWEVLRARKPGRRNPLIVYRKSDAKEHLSIMDRDSGVVGAFLRDCKKTKTNADRIRSMSDEELAEFLEKFGTFNQPCSLNTGEPLKWLQSEVEEQQMGKVIVHGYMVYRCEKCNREFRMWCEKGIEEGGENHKPSPLVIRHTCGGFSRDISGLFRVNKPRPNPMLNYDAGYMVLPEGESYFANKKGSKCGVPVFFEEVAEYDL